MNEAETRAEHIDPALAAAGWGVVEGSRIRREYPITLGRIEGRGRRGKALKADYVLEYRNTKLGTVEAKAWDEALTEGVGQAKDYATKLAIRYTYATNGQSIYAIDMETGHEAEMPRYPIPDELWAKTFVALQIAWKLFQSRWNLPDWKSGSEPSRRPRILFLADRNILANQAFNAFSAFPEDAMVRIEPDEIRKKGKVPKNGSLFFTIFQTFMTVSPRHSRAGGNPANAGNSLDSRLRGNDVSCGVDFGSELQFNFGDSPPDFFDFIVIDECHRGGANDESTWRKILEHFSPAVQLGLTATPKRKDNVDTYAYFGEPVFTYSLKEGINDGSLTLFRVKQILTTSQKL